MINHTRLRIALRLITLGALTLCLFVFSRPNYRGKNWNRAASDDEQLQLVRNQPTKTN